MPNRENRPLFCIQSLKGLSKLNQIEMIGYLANMDSDEYYKFKLFLDESADLIDVEVQGG